MVAVSPSATWCAAVSRAWAGKGPGAASRAYTRVRSDGPTRIALSTRRGPLMFVVPLIERKRDGGALTPEEWSALVAAYTAGRVPDYQMSALLMAVYFRGLERPELAAVTDAMLASGQRLAFDGWATPRIDKHSTGGVGDKVSLVLAPLVAACGVAVPMMSGRGLGHTGGTLDKLEAIPGFRTRLSLAETRAQVMKLCCAMIGQTPEIEIGRAHV